MNEKPIEKPVELHQAGIMEILGMLFKTCNLYYWKVPASRELKSLLTLRLVNSAFNNAIITLRNAIVATAGSQVSQSKFEVWKKLKVNGLDLINSYYSYYSYQSSSDIHIKSIMTQHPFTYCRIAGTERWKDIEASGILNQLQILDITSSHSLGKALEAIKQPLTELKHLNINGDLEEDFFISLNLKMPNLKFFGFNESKKLTSNLYLEHISISRLVLQNLRCDSIELILPHLTVISLANIEAVNDLQLRRILYNCPRLEKLSVTNCNLVDPIIASSTIWLINLKDNKKLEFPLIQCPSLREIFLQGCIKLKDDTLNYIVVNLPKISKIACTGCKSLVSPLFFTSSGTNKFASSMRIADCENLQSLIISNINFIRILSLNNLPRFTSEGVYTLLKMSPFLWKLYLRDCSNVVHIKIPYTSTNLEMICASECRELGSIEMADISKKDWHKLRSVSVLHSSKLTAESVYKLVDQFATTLSTVCIRNIDNQFDFQKMKDIREGKTSLKLKINLNGVRHTL